MPTIEIACQQDKNTQPPRLIQAGHAAPPKLLRYVDAANQMSVSLNHLRGLVDAGHLTSIKVGHRARRVLASEIEALVTHGIKQPGST